MMNIFYNKLGKQKCTTDKIPDLTGKLIIMKYKIANWLGVSKSFI